MTAAPEGTSHPPVIVVIPVYGGEKTTRACLASVAASDLPTYASVLMINDCSPEPAVKSLCEEFAREQGFDLLENAENLGFVATANRGMACNTEADVILLNSDTEVSGDWVQRLQACAYRRERTGTVTPFSNNGTICSYPVLMDSCPLPQGWNTGTLDRLFATQNAGGDAELPTAVGFCMYIRRACLVEVGLFDTQNFGLGYGEECDFSLRAQEAGWQNRIAADTFVYHEGNASFAGQSQQRKEQADKVIDRLHPHYHGRVLQFLQDDPLRDFRRKVDSARLELNNDEAATLLAERDRHVELTLERSATLLQELLEEKKQRREEHKQRATLEALLQQSRTQFSETDLALTAAQGHVDNLNESIAALNGVIADREDSLRSKYQEIDELRATIEQLQATIDQLRGTITNMEQSRSWRYTAFLRRG